MGKNKKIVIIALSVAGVLVLVIIIIAIFILSFAAHLPEKTDENLQKTKENACSPPVFTHEITDFDRINAFQPIGSISGASPGRSYIIVKTGETVPVYAPADATLVSIVYAYRGPDADHGEYGFWFDGGCGVSFLLDHLDTASDEMLQHAPKEPARDSRADFNLHVSVKAGTLLGYTDGTPQAHTFDFLAENKKEEVYHINPVRWEWDQSKYSICPYDLFTDELMARYYTKLGTYTNTGFQKADSCGSPSYDIDGTISGGWFLGPDSTDMKGQHLMVGAQQGWVDAIIKKESEGTSSRYTDYSPKVLPKDVHVGSSVCYPGFENNWIYLKLVDNDTLSVVEGKGNCPSIFPGAGAVTYQR